MKEAAGSHGWVPIVAGVVGVLAVGIALRQCGSRPAADEVLAEAQLSSRTRVGATERGGWSAQPRTGGVAPERSRPGTAGNRIPGSSDERGSAADEVAPPRREGASERQAGAGDFRDTDTFDAGGDAIAAQPHARQGGAPAPGDGAPDAADIPPGNSASGQQDSAPPTVAPPGASQTPPIDGSQDPAQAPTPDDEGPVLSLPLEHSTEPDKGGDKGPIIASGVEFDQDGARFSADAQLFLPSDGTVNQAAGTFTFWMLPDWAGDADSLFQILHLGGTEWANRFDIFKDHAYLRLLMAPNTGIEAGAGADIRDWQKGDRHMITATWGDGVVALYIDGVSVGASAYDGELDLGPSPPLFIGSGNPRVKAGANSNLRNFQMYARALHPDEIVALFAQPPY